MPWQQDAEIRSVLAAHSASKKAVPQIYLQYYYMNMQLEYELMCIQGDTLPVNMASIV